MKPQTNLSRFKVGIEKGDERSDWDTIQNEIMKWLGYSRGRTLNLLKGKKPNEIRDIRKKAEAEGKNPKALFQYLMRV